MEDLEKLLEDYKTFCKEKRDETPYYVSRDYNCHGNPANINSPETLFGKRDVVIVTADAGLGKTFAAKYLRYSWATGKSLPGKRLLYFDCKEIDDVLNILKPCELAPFYFSQLKEFIKNESTECLALFDDFIDEIVVIIDGFEVLPLEQYLNDDFVEKLEIKINQNEEISAMETVIGIYLCFLLPGAKVLLFGRKQDINHIRSITPFKCVAVELQPFNKNNIKALIGHMTCATYCLECNKCQALYSLIVDGLNLTDPSDIIALLKFCTAINKPEDFPKFTRTKLFLYKLFQKVFSSEGYEFHKHYYVFYDWIDDIIDQNVRKDIQNIPELAFYFLLENKKVIQTKEFTRDGTVYFEFERDICIRRWLVERLDLFYIRRLDTDVCSLEPRRLSEVMMFGAIYLFRNTEKWDLISELSKDYKLLMIPFLAGMHAATEEPFIENIAFRFLKMPCRTIEIFFDWFYKCNHKNLPSDSYWYGITENQNLTPCLLLDAISREVKIPDNFIPKTIVCSSNVYTAFTEWYDMEKLKKYQFITGHSKRNFDEFNFKLALKISFQFKIEGQIGVRSVEHMKALIDITSADLNFTIKVRQLIIYNEAALHCLDDNQAKQFFEMCADYVDEITLKGVFFTQKQIENLKFLLEEKEQPDNFYFVISGQIGLGTAQQLTTFIDFATFLSTNTSSITLKAAYLIIDNAEVLINLNDSQTMLFFDCCTKYIDVIILKNVFLSANQIVILKSFENRLEKQLNFALDNISIDNMIALPLLNKRHFSYTGVKLTDEDLLLLKRHLDPNQYSDSNLDRYKIVNYDMPFIPKQKNEFFNNSFYLHLNHVDFRSISPQIFADVLSKIPTIECRDNIIIPSSHWLELSSAENCWINELRIWYPKIHSLDSFIKIKTKTLQLCGRFKMDLKEVVNWVVSHSFRIQPERTLRVFSITHAYERCWDEEVYAEVEIIPETRISEIRVCCKELHLVLEDNEEDDDWTTKWCCEIRL